VASTEPFAFNRETSKQASDVPALLLLDTPFCGSTAQLQQLSPTALAYLGDAVYELYVRRFYLLPPKRLQTYHNQVVAQVRAESQARHLQALQSALTETEQEIVRRARNAAPKGPKRVDPALYQQATGFEALLGYLYLFDPQRLSDLLSQLQLTELPVSTSTVESV
jgi:ribonuclease III family protein